MISPSRRAKIVATLGPASSDQQTIENLIKAGVNVFRFNFSHGSHEDHKLRLQAVRKAAQTLNSPVAILQDLQGPKLRVGRFENGSMDLEKGEEVLFVQEKILEEKVKNQAAASSSKLKVIPYNYELLSKEIKAGHRILMDDGNLEVVITAVNSKTDEIKAQVIFGGQLKNNKGMNFPDTKISIAAFTSKDKEDLLFALKMGFDFIALSFVRTANDIRLVQRFMHGHRKNIPVIAKIEMSEAIDNLQEILEVSDGIMVARGDLAVEVGTAKVPSLQKQIIRECNERGIPVITATQMLESMIQLPRPTRAEASDVANAVLDGTDALMLSAETASGKFPVLSVSVMHSIILETELRRAPRVTPRSLAARLNHDVSIVEAIESAASQMAFEVGARVIACTTHTGQAALALARNRPVVPIVAYTDSEEVRRQMSLVWGVETRMLDEKVLSKVKNLDVDVLFSFVETNLVECGYVEKNDLIVLTAGWPPLKHGTTNLLKVVTVTQEAPEKKESKATQKKKAAELELMGYRTKKAQFVLDQALCIQCGGCVEVCPNDIFGQHNRKVYLKESNCKNCTFDDACVQICPTGAIEIIKLSD